MWRTVILVALTAALCAASLAGMRRLDHVAGRTFAEHPAQRIISLVPALTETCFALGLGDRLVGRTAYCNDPPEARSLPDVGGLLDPNIERILMLDPDLLLVARSGKDLRGQLDAAGLPYLAVPNDSLDDVFEAIRLIADRCGVPARGAELTDRLRHRMNAVRARAAGVAPKRALLSISASRVPMSPPWVVGPDSYLGTLVGLTGHRVVPENLGVGYGEISFEEVLRTDPDVIIEVRGLAGEPPVVADNPESAWGTLGDLAAVRGRRVLVLHGPRHVTPGPRFVDTLDELQSLLSR